MRDSTRIGLIASAIFWTSVSCSPDSSELGTAPSGTPPVALSTTGTDTLVASEDLFIRSGSRNSNYGSKDSLRVRSIAGSNDTNRVLVAFSQAGIAGVLAGRTVTSATLVLTLKAVSNVASGGVNLDIHRVLRAWTQSGGTWNCAQDSNIGNSVADCPSTGWQMSGSAQNAFTGTRTAQVHIVNAQTGTISFNVTSDVSAFVAGTSNLGWAVKTSSEAQSARVVLRAKESTTASMRPRLVLLSAPVSAAQPPDTVPAWFQDDTSYAAGGFLKRVLAVVFREAATSAQRQSAIALVGGTTIGGMRYSTGDGVYYLSISDDGSGTQLSVAEATLSANSQVEAAALTYNLSPTYRRSIDGATYGRLTWSLSPDSVSGDNWGLEAIDAPFAWGCSVGDSSTNVAIVDHLFDNTDVVKNATSPVPPLGAVPADTNRHGTKTSNIVAARGNDSLGMTGVMWRAKVQLLETGKNPQAATVAGKIEVAAQRGATVVNISFGKDWGRANVLGDTLVLQRIVRMMMPPLKKLQLAGKLPLIVVSSGNGTRDARWAAVPILRDSFPTNVLVVGATDSARNLAWFSNDGALVETYAPGDHVGSLGANGLPIRVSGTSFSAPYVSGIAGLLKAFDSRLTPVDLRNLILAGADSGKRSVGTTGRNLVNAYEALKAAARRPGAPICGNRIWVDGDAIRVQRTASTDETIAHIPGDYLMYTAHDGHYIGLGTGSVVFSQGSWAVHPTGDYTIEPSGASNSFRGLSHDPEFYAFVRQLVWNGDSLGRPPTAGVYVADTLGHETQVTTFNGFRDFVNYTAAYPPRGNRLLVPINPDGINLAMRFYGVDLTTGQAALLWSLPDVIALSLGISEDGSEAMLSYEAYPSSTCTIEFRTLPSGAMVRSFQVAKPPGSSGCATQVNASARVAKVP